jgi:hypothetical protein
MGNVVSGRLRLCCLAATVAVAALAAAPSAYAGITITGANATSTVDCRNVAPGDKQKNKCGAQAQGGDVSLKNVDIYFRGAVTMQVNGGGVSPISIGGGDATAGAVCVNEAGSMLKTKQISICRVWSQGGKVAFRNVQIAVHHKNGTTTTKRRDLLALGSKPAVTHAVCAKNGNAIARCNADASGARVGMNHVDVVDHANNTTSRDVAVSITGGDATALVHCANTASGSAVQINFCSAKAVGGDVTLQDVRLHVTE